MRKVDLSGLGRELFTLRSLRRVTDLRSRTRFEPSDVEPRIVQRWLERPAPSEPAGTPDENFSIAVPPPNVTGALHMGHALNGTIQDALIRTHRMRGQRTKWILGTDHAGIATQRQVEKRLEARADRQELGREAFSEAVWTWREEFGGSDHRAVQAPRRALDYDDERFTMDEGYVRAVLKVFVDLYEQGLIYRDTYMVNWDPGLRSAISDLEVEDREGVVDPLYSIAYPLADGGGEVVVATVRPRRCSPTRRSPCTRTTIASATSSGARWCCRSSGGA